MYGLIPFIPIFKSFIFFKKILREWEFKFLCETYLLGSCKTHYCHAVFVFNFEHMQVNLGFFIVNFEHLFVSWAQDKVHKTT